MSVPYLINPPNRRIVANACRQGYARTVLISNITRSEALRQEALCAQGESDFLTNTRDIRDRTISSFVFLSNTCDK
ncbi:MAG: hypothetical protein LBB84_10775 [Tannerellaceae bacterium]|nr:hypothetical protein [Tannerellaceae bacterium]